MQTIATSTIPQEVPLSALVPSPTNPRQHFDEDKLNELADFVTEAAMCRMVEGGAHSEGHITDEPPAPLDNLLELL